MAVNTTGITPLANWITTQWAPELSDATKANTGLSGLVDTSYEDVMKFGSVLNIPDRSHVAIRVKSEDTTATWANITETRQQVTINRQAYAAFLVEDIGELQSKYEVRSGYSEDTSYSLMAYLEGDATSGLASLPNSFSNLVGALGGDLTDDDYIQAKTYLDVADVPMDGRFLYLTPTMHNGLLKMGRWTNADFIGSANAVSTNRNAQITGKCYGADALVSTLAENNPSAANQAYGWFCQRRGVALIRQRGPKVHTQEIILEIGMGVLVDMIYQFAERLIMPKTLGGGTPDDKFNVGLRGV